MDLAKLEKKAFFIPTPGQYEQEYLAKRLQKKGWFPFAEQGNFTLENLEEIDSYTPWGRKQQPIHWKNLLCLFERKGEF
jgi:hypothetical protein